MQRHIHIKFGKLLGAQQLYYSKNYNSFSSSKTLTMRHDLFLLTVLLLYCVIFIMIHSHLKRISESSANGFAAIDENQENSHNIIKEPKMAQQVKLLDKQLKDFKSPKYLLQEKRTKTKTQHQNIENFKIKHEYSQANILIQEPKMRTKKPNARTHCYRCQKVAHSGSFQNISGIFVLSTFYDHRIPSEHLVRAIVLQENKDKRELVCWFKNGTYLLQSHAKKYEMCENHGRKFGGWIYSCKIPKWHTSIKTVYLSIYTTDASMPMTKLNLISLTKKENGKTFGVCIPPMFGSMQMTKLVQFLELSHILGASRFHIYLHNASNSVHIILNHYVKLKLVSLTKWELPSTVIGDNIWYHGQLIAIQDCLYRNMASFQYLIFSDLDEIVIPRNVYTWAEMLESIKNISPNNNNSHIRPVGFSFKSTFFDPWQTPDTMQQLSYLQLLERSKGVSSVRTKVLVQPDQVFEMGIHHLSKPIMENMTVTKVSPDIALIHHYRPCMLKYEPSMQCRPKMRDTTILKYSKQLQSSYNQRIKELFKGFL